MTLCTGQGRVLLVMWQQPRPPYPTPARRGVCMQRTMIQARPLIAPHAHALLRRAAAHDGGGGGYRGCRPAAWVEDAVDVCGEWEADTTTDDTSTSTSTTTTTTTCRRHHRRPIAIIADIR